MENSSFDQQSSGPTNSTVELVAAATGATPASSLVSTYADVDLGNVAGADFAAKAFPVPIGTSGAGPVPSDLKSRFKHWANAVTDGGVSLYDSAGNLKDNQPELQDLIDKVQAYDGAVFIPPQDGQDGHGTAGFYLTSGLVQRDTGSLQGKSVALIGLGANDRTVGLNGRPYDAGVGLKLYQGSNSSLIRSQPKAGLLILENLTLAIDQSVQSSNQYGIEWEDNLEGPGFGGHLDQVYVFGAGRAGIRIGSAGGQGRANWTWVLYCGADGDAGWNVGSADWIFTDTGSGSNHAGGWYLGSGSQIQMTGGATWMNGTTGMVVSEYCESIAVANYHFDTNAQDGLVALEYVQDSARRGARQFTNCMWSDNGQAADDTYSDIALGDGVDDVTFVASAFVGKNTGVNRVRHSIKVGTGSSAWMIAPRYVASGAKKSFKTAFTNDFGAIRVSGAEEAYWRMGASGQGAEAIMGGTGIAALTPTDAWLGGLSTGASLRVKNFPAAVNYLEACGDANPNPYLIASGAAADVNLNFAPKGSGAVVVKAGNGAVKIQANNTGLGFHGAAPVAKPTITGSRGGNAALTSLLTQLNATGLINDQTT
jgi:hypothetical protein